VSLLEIADKTYVLLWNEWSLDDEFYHEEVIPNGFAGYDKKNTFEGYLYKLIRIHFIYYSAASW